MAGDGSIGGNSVRNPRMEGLVLVVAKSFANQEKPAVLRRLRSQRQGQRFAFELSCGPRLYIDVQCNSAWRLAARHVEQLIGADLIGQAGGLRPQVVWGGGNLECQKT